MTTSLRETIENFHAYVLGEEGAIEGSIVGSDDGFKHTRLNVYQEGYYLRLLEILAKEFPSLEKLIGEQRFEEIAHDYICKYPSHSYSVRYFGQHFHQFLTEMPDIDPLWAELALFELTLEDVIDAKDAPQVTFEEMAQLSPESWGNLILVTHPSLKIIPFHYQTPPLWQALMQDKAQPTLERKPQSIQWLLWRFNRQSLFRAVDEQQLWMLHALQEGQTFSQVCEGLCQWLDEEKIIPFAAETLRQWISEGIFSEYRVS